MQNHVRETHERERTNVYMFEPTRKRFKEEQSVLLQVVDLTVESSPVLRLSRPMPILTKDSLEEEKN